MTDKKKSSKRVTKKARIVSASRNPRRNNSEPVKIPDGIDQPLMEASLPIVEVHEKKMKFGFQDLDSWLPVIIELLIYVVVFISLKETLDFLYADDDLMSSLLKGQVFGNVVTTQSFYEFLLGQLTLQLSIGRVMIGALPTVIPILFFNVLQYRFYVLFLICIDVWLFGKCVYQWTGSYKIKWLSMVSTPLFFQIYFNMHHPILSYYGGMQLLFLILFSSLFFFWKYCMEYKKSWLIISSLFYLWGLTFYEVSFVFIFVFILLAYFATKDLKKSVLNSFTHLVLMGVLITANFVNRVGMQSNYAGSTFGFDIPRIIKTTLKQMTATVPLSNFMESNWNQFKSIFPKLFSVNQIIVDDIVTVILFLVVLFFILQITENFVMDKKNTFLLGILGFSIIALPSGLMGLSAKYQVEISWGRGHIPVYIQYYGLILFFIAGYILFKEWIKRFNNQKAIILSTNTLLVLLSAFILLANQQYGRAWVKNYDAAMYDNMLAMQYALEDGLIQDIPNNARIINTQVVPTGFTNSEYSSLFFVNYSRKQLRDVIYVDDFINSIIGNNGVTGQASMLEYTPQTTTYIIRTNHDAEKGNVYIGRVKKIIIDSKNKQINRVDIDELGMYTMNQVTSKYISLYENVGGISENHQYYSLDKNLIKSGENGRIYKLDFGGDVVDFNSVFIVNDLEHIDPNIYEVIKESALIDLGQPIIIGGNLDAAELFKSGWSGAEDWGRWSEGNQSSLLMKIKDTPDRDLQVNFTARIYAPKEDLLFSVSVNGVNMNDFSLPAGQHTFSILVPRENIIKNHGHLEITFNMENPISPQLAGYSDDPRTLGIGLESFIVKEKNLPGE